MSNSKEHAEQITAVNNTCSYSFISEPIFSTHLKLQYSGYVLR